MVCRSSVPSRDARGLQYHQHRDHGNLAGRTQPAHILDSSAVPGRSGSALPFVWIQSVYNAKRVNLLGRDRFDGRLPPNSFADRTRHCTACILAACHRLPLSRRSSHRPHGHDVRRVRIFRPRRLYAASATLASNRNPSQSHGGCCGLPDTSMRCSSPWWTGLVNVSFRPPALALAIPAAGRSALHDRIGRLCRICTRRLALIRAPVIWQRVRPGRRSGRHHAVRRIAPSLDILQPRGSAPLH